MTAAAVIAFGGLGMVGQLDQISRAIGSIEAKVDGLEVRAEEDREISDARHVENKEAIRGLTVKIETHAIPVQPEAWMSKWRLTGLVSIGLTVLGGLGLVAETAIKWFVNWALSHFHW